jgi:hypothetical protein
MHAEIWSKRIFLIYSSLTKLKKYAKDIVESDVKYHKRIYIIEKICSSLVFNLLFIAMEEWFLSNLIDIGFTLFKWKKNVLRFYDIIFQLYGGGQFLLVEETGVPEENQQPVTSHWQTLSHNQKEIIPMFLLVWCLYYLFKEKMGQDPFCTCKQIVTSEHFLLYCSTYQ